MNRFTSKISDNTWLQMYDHKIEFFLWDNKETMMAHTKFDKTRSAKCEFFYVYHWFNAYLWVECYEASLKSLWSGLLKRQYILIEEIPTWASVFYYTVMLTKTLWVYSVDWIKESHYILYFFYLFQLWVCGQARVSS